MMLLFFFLPLAWAYEVPSVSFPALDAAAAKKALASVGALRVTDVPGFFDARRRFLQRAPRDCVVGDSAFAQLEDGTRRLTVGAKSDRGVAPARLAACEELSTVRDLVELASRRLFHALDSDASMPPYDTLTQLMHAGEHLEHVHAYETEEEESHSTRRNNPSLPRHTDAGLMISMVGDYGDAATLSLELPDGRVVDVDDDDDAILFLVGQGAVSFLSRGSLLLRPAPHAVKVHRDRLWYGKMWLPPADALVKSSGLTWSEHRETLVREPLSHDGLVVADVGCSSMIYDDDEEERGSSSSSSTPERRFLSAVTSELCKTQNGKDGILCWAQCVAVEDLECSADEVQCVEFSSGKVLDGSTDCPGHSFADCGPVCANNAANATSSFDDGGFCVGEGVVMYMDGFRSAFETNAPLCVNFWNTKWTLRSKFRFAWGVVGAFCVGGLVEALIWLRRCLFRKRGSSPRTKAAALLALHFVQSVFGFLAMFLAMTYNVEIFLAVCLGATVGHFVFNFSNLPTASDPCCAAAAQSEELRSTQQQRAISLQTADEEEETKDERRPSSSLVIISKSYVPPPTAPNDHVAAASCPNCLRSANFDLEDDDNDEEAPPSGHP